MITEYDVLETMAQYGGSFVQQLAKLTRLADSENKRRLVEAFPEYFKQYREMAARIEGRNL